MEIVNQLGTICYNTCGGNVQSCDSNTTYLVHQYYVIMKYFLNVGVIFLTRVLFL